MAYWKVSVKQTYNVNGICLIRGMFVEVKSFFNPVATNYGYAAQKAFAKIHGVDLRKIGMLTLSMLEVEKIR